MVDKSLNSYRQPRPIRWYFVCALLTAISAAYTYWQLARVRSGTLFAFKLPGDAPANSFEVADAILSANAYLVPSVLTVIVIGCVIAIRPWVHLKPMRITGAWIILAALFAISAVADLVTTLRFFHELGVDHELHPGIRLFGYAYGRTVGPVIAKTLQAISVLVISRWIGKAGIVLLALATLACISAALYNASLEQLI